MRKTSIAALAAAAIAITGAGVLATTGSGIAAPAVSGPTADAGNPPAAPQNNAAIEWNQALLDITAAPPAPGAAPSTVQPTRNFAILALAIDGAVNCHRPHPSTHHRRTDRGPWRVGARGGRQRRSRRAGGAVPGPPRGPRHPAGQRSRHPAERQRHPARHSRGAGGGPHHPGLACP